MKLNVLCITDRRDEIEFPQWITRVIYPILNRDNDERQKLGVTKKRLEDDVSDHRIRKYLQEEGQEDLNLKLKDSNNLRESNILINEIDTIESTLGRLSDLKYGDISIFHEEICSI